MHFAEWLVIAEGNMVRTYYHVTFWKNLDSISEEDLVPNYAPNWHAQYVSHSQKGTFFANTLERARFWVEKLEMIAENNYEDIVGDEVIPVILRVRINSNKVHPDDIENDADKDSYFAKAVPAVGIELWDGVEWVWGVGRAYIDPDRFVNYQESGEYDANGEEIQYAYFNRDYPFPTS